jgi:ABC-type bacteriocin/lantibiotic exporter with double-glycine peptidase domain
MGRSHISPIQQPTDYTCGPTSLKTAFHIFGIHKSLPTLIKLCKTTRNGTTTKNLIRACNSLGFSVLAVEYATLTHLQSALKYSPYDIRAVLVSYLYDLDEKKQPHPDSGHWAVVSSYAASKNRIVLLDSASNTKKSYNWQDFRKRWKDYDLKRKKDGREGHTFRLIRHWQPQLMLVIARDVESLPKFKTQTSKLFVPSSSKQM